MSRIRVCAGELIGCQPSWRELEDIWALALQGVDADSRKVLLAHTINAREVARDETLEKLRSEIGDPLVLDNMSLMVEQESPFRSIDIRIGPGRITSVTVEAEDSTWAIGRHTEIMEKLLGTRRKYALGTGYAPRWPMRKSFSLRSAILFFPGAISAIIGAYLLVFLIVAYISIIYAPAYQIAMDLAHHKEVPYRLIALVPFSIAALAIAISASLLVAGACKSKVIVRKKSLWNSNRTSALGSLAAAISAFTGLFAMVFR